MFNSILVVCIGNICRSPMGEAILKYYLPGMSIASAGVGAVIGAPAEANAIAVAGKRNLDLTGHIARQLTPEMCHQYDLILVMNTAMIDSVAKIAPSAHGKTMLFGQWSTLKNVPDPYQQDQEMFELVYNQLNEAARLWASKLIHT